MTVVDLVQLAVLAWAYAAGVALALYAVIRVIIRTLTRRGGQ